MLDEYMIYPGDLKYMLFTDSTEEALEHIRKFALEKYRAKRKSIFKKYFLPGE
jgi:hypothetical protein